MAGRPAKKKAATRKKRTAKAGSGERPSSETPPDPTLTDAVASGIAEVEGHETFGMMPKLPPRLLDGQPNPAHFRAKLAEVNELERKAMHGLHEVSKGFDFKKMREGLFAEAKTYNIDPRHIEDTRTKEEKALDVIARCAESGRAIYESTDDELDAIEEVFHQAKVLGYAYAETKLDPGKVKQSGKVLEVVRRVRSLRDKARTACPNVANAGGKVEQYVWRATHLIRHMAWIRRSDFGKTPAEKVMHCPPHFVKAVMDIYDAEHGVMHIPHLLEDKREIRYEQYPCPGVVVWMPPAHGKTTISVAWVTRRIDEVEGTRGAWLHAAGEKAEDALAVVKAAFKDDNEEGRRNIAMYPHRILSSANDNLSTMRMESERRSKSPTLSAAGIMGKALGDDHDFQVRDDIVPQDDAYEPTTRKRRVGVLAATWDTRLREDPSRPPFTLNVGYPWHEQDALCNMVAQARRDAKKGRNSGMAVSVQRVVEHGEKITPVWPDVYGTRVLRHKRSTMPRDLWRSNYLMDPSPESDRIIKKLRFYCPAAAEHEQFMRTSQGRLSLDPAGTNRDTSDPAGVLYACDGQVYGARVDETGNKYRDMETQLRVVEAHEVKANQTELFQFGSELALRQSIDYVYAEMVSGYAATGEIWANNLGIEVIPCPTGNKSKAIRLKRVSHLIDDSIPSARAVVLFPGKGQYDDAGNPVLDPKTGEHVVDPDPEMQWLYEQFLNFGQVKNDHVVDCLSQLCGAMAEELDIGKGVVSQLASRFYAEQPRHVQYIRRVMASKKVRTDPEGDECRFMENRWS